MEIALPQVFDQPTLTTLQRGKIANVNALIATIARRHRDNPDAPLGTDYQALVNEFQPFFIWVIACWDYLLSTEGCRFIPRYSEQKFGVRGDYRAVTDKDYSRMVHGIFRQCVFAFSSNGYETTTQSLTSWLREQFWPLILEAYRRLEQPADPRQRILTPYSYLRCVPYQFLNEFHHELVYSTIQRLSSRERRAIETYFLQFHTEAATAEVLNYPLEECLATLRRGLLTLLLHHRLVYCLLRQIERY